MSRSGYIDDCDDQWALIRYRGAVKSAIRGRRGQAFLKEMLAALDALPEKRLIADELIIDGENGGFIVGADQITDERGEVCRVGDVCAIGSVGRMRNINISNIDPHDAHQVAPAFGIAEALAREIVYENDEAGASGKETPEARFLRVRAWVEGNIKTGSETLNQRSDHDLG